MAEIKNYNLKDTRFLLVEKQVFMRRIIRGILMELGVREIEECAGIDEAIEAFSNNPSDVILTDWAPGVDAIRLLHWLRTNSGSPNPFVPVVVVTANTELRHIYQARDAGMTEFLAKPISAMLLYSRICSVIERQRAFIKCSGYFGPDRRRRELDFGGEERRINPFTGPDAVTQKR